MAQPDPVNRFSRALSRAAPRWDGEIDVLRSKLHFTIVQRVTCHLVAAAKFLTEAKALPSGSTEQLGKFTLANAEVQAALKLDEKDADALELAAKVAKLQNATEPLHRAMAALERVAQEQPVRRSRFLRYEAELFEERGTRAALNNARVKLETALKLLDDGKTDPGEPLEEALVNEQLARVHLTRGTTTRMGPYLNRAQALFEILPAPNGPAGMVRLEELRAKLQEAAPPADRPR